MESVETREKQVEMLKVGLSVSNMSPENIKQTNAKWKEYNFLITKKRIKIVSVVRVIPVKQ